MGTIISKLEDISSVSFTQLRKGRVVNAKRVLAVTDNSVIIELENGQFTVAGNRHSPNGNWAVMGYGLDKFTASVLDGLVKLGVLSKSDVSKHKADEAKRSSDRDKIYAKRRLAEACETLGIKNPLDGDV